MRRDGRSGMRDPRCRVTGWKGGLPPLLECLDLRRRATVNCTLSLSIPAVTFQERGQATLPYLLLCIPGLTFQERGKPPFLTCYSASQV